MVTLSSKYTRAVTLESFCARGQGLGVGGALGEIQGPTKTVDGESQFFLFTVIQAVHVCLETKIHTIRAEALVTANILNSNSKDKRVLGNYIRTVTSSLEIKPWLSNRIIFAAACHAKA
jgi:hypothetical protein